MCKQEKITFVLGTAMLYTVITSAFTLLQKIRTSIFSQGTISNKLSWFLQRNTLWIIVVAAIIIILDIYIKRSNQKVSSIVAENPIIGLVTGVLVVINSIFDLASTLPVNIISVKSVFEAIQHIDAFLDGSKESMILQTILTNALSIVIILCQMVLGIYLVNVYKKKVD